MVAMPKRAGNAKVTIQGIWNITADNMAVYSVLVVRISCCSLLPLSHMHLISILAVVW